MRNSSFEGVHQIRCFPLPEEISSAGFRNVIFHSKLDDGQSPNKEDYFSLQVTVLLEPFQVAFLYLPLLAKLTYECMAGRHISVIGILLVK